MVSILMVVMLFAEIVMVTMAGQSIFHTRSESAYFLRGRNSGKYGRLSYAETVGYPSAIWRKNTNLHSQHNDVGGIASGEGMDKSRRKRKRGFLRISLYRTRYTTDECASNPCHHGWCNDFVHRFTCTCQGGYEGIYCQIDTDECASNPCVHGTCVDHVNRYSCTCEPGYGGKNCQTDINECSSQPCLNGATCNDLIDRYSCTCLDDYTGPNCETDMCYPSKGADIATILDSSSSQTPTTFDRQKEFIKSLINAFPIGINNFAFCAISVTNNAIKHFDLDTHLTNESLLNAIDDLKFMNGTTNLHSALSSARNGVFQTSNKTKYLFILGDGMYGSTRDTIHEAILTKLDNVTLISIGVGRQILHQGLIDVSSDYRHVFPSTTDDLKIWLLRKHAMETCPNCKSMSADVFILFETSSNGGLPIFYRNLDILKKLVHKIPVAQQRAHVSIAMYDNVVTELFDFLTHYTHHSIITTVLAKTKMTQQTSDYVNALRHVENNVFISSKGHRIGNRKVVIMLMSEVIPYMEATKKQADAVKSQNITLVIITSTSQAKPNMTSLLEMTSDPYFLFVMDERVYEATSALDALATLFEYSECDFD